MGRHFGLLGKGQGNLSVRCVYGVHYDLTPPAISMLVEKGIDRVFDPEKIVERKADDKDPFSALMFKIQTDPFVGKLIFFRVYSGVLKAGDTVMFGNNRNTERIGRILRMHANQREEIKEIYAGDIGATVALKNGRVGYTMCDVDKPVLLEQITFPEPVISVAIEPKTKADEEKMMSTALRNSDRLADMINSILDFSKIESGQMTVAQRQTNPEKIAREAVESVTPWVSKKHLGLALSVVPGLPPVYADEKRTVQVLINLLSNAIKFTPAGGRITVSLARARDNPEKFLDFAVADTGPGIAQADQKKVFEKFVQVASGEMTTAGTGLGLSIAKALVHLQGGVLGVESELGRGATFAFTLPVYIPPREESFARAPSGQKKSPSWWKKLLGLK